ncbi:MAG: M28 family peptidase [Bacteroidota bacterium]
MIKTTQFTLLFTLLSLTVSAQEATKSNDFQLTAPNDPVPYAETITQSDMEAILTVLAADDMQGRETGTPGNDKAAKFIEGKLVEMGIPKVDQLDGYFQKIAFSSETWEDIVLKVNDKEYRHLWEFYSFANLNSDRATQTINEVIFLGYGIDDPNYSDYKGKDVKGKTILIYDGEPKKKGISYVTKTSEVSDWSTDRKKKLMAAHQNGVANVLIIDGNIKNNLGELRRELLDGRMKMGAVADTENLYANSAYISTDVAKAIIGKKIKKLVKRRAKIEKKGKSKSLALTTDITFKQTKNVRQLLGNNILGFIEGTDPVLKNEIVVVSAHYDHIGMRGKNAIYNGADDNGSGSTTVLEVAQAFKAAKDAGVGPRRSVLTLWVTGEEKGLLGSAYYAEFPVFPLENTIVDVNVDMVGRVHEKYADNPNYIYVIGADRLSTELHKINEAANAKYTNLILDYTYNDENDPNRFYYRSDHYNFAKNGIPAVFYFNGTHADYHMITDTIEKINFEKMEKIGRLIFHTAWELANRDKRIVVDVE